MGRFKSGGRSLGALQDRIDKHAGGVGGETGDICLPPDRIDVWQLPSMQAAADTVRRRSLYFPHGGSKHRREYLNSYDAQVREMCMGNDKRITGILAQSDALIEEAIKEDPRLARRAKWHRGEDGEIACPALIAQGDDAPYFYRNRSDVSESNGGEPVRVVISTDSNAVVPGTAAAFIATVRLVQQWRSVEVWWQGAWLSDDGHKGWVFHVPLVQGDMDFTRLDYCISDKTRDNVSYAIMMTRACETTKRVWNGCNNTARWSYLPGESKFVSHTGIMPKGDSIATRAASWLDWEGAGWNDYVIRKAAVQELPPLPSRPESAADQAATEQRMKEFDERQRKQRLAESAARAAALSRKF